MPGNHRSGPVQQPIEQLKARGAYRKSRHAKKEAVKIPGKSVRPRSLKGFARSLWDSAIKPLIDSGVVTPADVPTATAVCELWDLYKQSYKLAEKNPTDKELRCAVTDYIRAFDGLASRFGLTPIDRRKIQPAKPESSKPRVASRQIAGRINA